MEYSSLKDKIILLLEKIVERNNFLNSDKQLSLLEIDILMADMRELYDVYSQIRQQVENKDGDGGELAYAEEPSRKEPPSERTTEKVAEEPKPTPAEAQKEEEAPEVEQNNPVEEDEGNAEPIMEEPVEETEENNENPQPEEEKQEVKQEPVVEKEQVQEPASEVKPKEPEVNKPSTVGEKFENDSDNQAIGEMLGSIENSLHDKISGSKEDVSIGARMQQKSISSLKDAIGVNEKFLFINELFNGNIQDYNEAIDKLNNFGDINEAFEYINGLTARFAWDGNRSATTIEKFASLVQRRYMNN